MLAFLSFYTRRSGFRALHSLNKSAQIYPLSQNGKVHPELKKDSEFATKATELILELAIQTFERVTTGISRWMRGQTYQYQQRLVG